MANPNLTDLMIEVTKNNLLGVSKLLEIPSQVQNIDKQSNTGMTALHYACIERYDMWSIFLAESIVDVLLKKGANPNIIDNNGFTPLYIAFNRGPENLKIIALLLQNGADPNIKSNYGYTVLHIAAYCLDNDDSVIQLLLKHKADPNIKDNNGCTSLYTALKKEYTPLTAVESFLEYGADPNAADNDSWTPLLIFLGNANDDDNTTTITRLLLTSGANPNAVTNYGKTLLEEASYRKEVVKLLLEYGATPIDEETQILQLQIKNKKLEKEKELLIENNKNLKEEIELLETHIDYMPEGQKYLEVKKRFEEKNY